MTVTSGEGAEWEGALGLEMHTVRVVAHRPEWQGLYEEERRALLERVGHLAVAVQHAGSTAVPGLGAKPIIDIALPVPSTEAIPHLVRPLGELGYVYRGDAGNDGGHMFGKKSAPDVRIHHLHVMAADDPQWHEWLLFRDKLRADEELRARYFELKKALQKRYAGDRKGYIEAKYEFVRGLVHSRPKHRHKPCDT